MERGGFSFENTRPFEIPKAPVSDVKAKSFVFDNTMPFDTSRHFSAFAPKPIETIPIVVKPLETKENKPKKPVSEQSRFLDFIPVPLELNVTDTQGNFDISKTVPLEFTTPKKSKQKAETLRKRTISFVPRMSEITDRQVDNYKPEESLRKANEIDPEFVGTFFTHHVKELEQINLLTQKIRDLITEGAENPTTTSIKDPDVTEVTENSNAAELVNLIRKIIREKVMRWIHQENSYITFLQTKYGKDEDEEEEDQLVTFPK